MINFYFFHIGENVSLPKMMVQSIRITNGNSQIFQITDRFLRNQKYRQMF